MKVDYLWLLQAVIELSLAFVVRAIFLCQKNKAHIP